MQRSHPLPVELTPEAELDLLEILLYTTERFGVQQKGIYQQWLKQAIDHIALNPDFGRATSIPGYLRYHISWKVSRGSHYIYYRVSGETLQIIRILHQSREYTGQYPFNQ